MKTFLALLLSCLTLSAATTYPVLTDSTNRLFPGGVTNVFFLNSNVVTTGTMRATGALTLTNASNVFAGDGSGLTGISAGVSTSGGSATNLSVYSSGGTNRPLRVFGGSQTNSNPTQILNTWNDSGVTFTGFEVVATNTSAALGSIVARFGASDMGGGGFPVTIYDRYTRFGSYGAGTANDARIENVTGGTDIVAYDESTRGVGLSGYTGVNIKSSRGILWWSGAAYSGAADTAIHRNSAGVLEINSGTTGAYRDLILRSIYATNLYATNLIVNGGATVTKILSATATLNFDLTALTVEDLTITVTGAADGDVVTLGVPNGSITTSVQYTAWVSAADTVTVRARTSAAGENPASGTFRATVIKH